MARIANLVHQQSTTTGTGNFTLSTVNGKNDFNTAFGNGSNTDIFEYFISNQNAAEWERGTGHMSSSTVLVRDTVIQSTNANAAVNFSAGTKDVTCDQPAGSRREVLTAARSYYVRTDGSDSNDGLANTSARAFLTIQKAINTVAALDISIYNVTINVAAGTYTGSNTVTGPWVGSGVVTLNGDTATPSNCVIQVAGNCLLARSGGTINVQGFKFISTGTAQLRANTGGSIITSGLNEFNNATTHRIFAEGQGQITCSANETVSGTAGQGHYCAAYGGFIQAQGITWTASGTATQGTFALSQSGFIMSLSATSSGTFSGVRYNATVNGAINVFGGGANYFPGNSAGTTATGGQYA